MEKKFNIRQNVFVGVKWTEHQYPPLTSNFVGRWQKYGGKVYLNESVESILCAQCSTDYFHRQKTREFCGIKESSYQVENFTYPEDKWDWDLCLCRNLSNCWGPAERLFDLKRKRDFYQMTHIKVINGTHEQIEDRQYFTLYRKSNYPNRFTGVINRFSRPSFFWPNLFDGEPLNDCYIINVDNQTNLPLPEHMKGSPFCHLPKIYQDPRYKFVNSFQFEIFRKNPENPWPTSLLESKQKHHPVAITTLNLYPGGSGFECKQYKFLKNKDFDKSVKSSDSDMSWTDTEFIHPFEAFIPNKQDGYAGPITSFFHRVELYKSFFYITFLFSFNKGFIINISTNASS